MKNFLTELFAAAIVIFIVCVIIMFAWKMTEKTANEQTELSHKEHAIWQKLNPEIPLTYEEWVIAYNARILNSKK